MTAQAHVERDYPALRGVKIHLAESQHDGTGYYARFADVEMERYEASAAAVTEVDPRPLRLTDDQARAVYEALARYFGGAPDMAQLRADYENERGRVDRLIGFLKPRGVG